VALRRYLLHGFFPAPMTPLQGVFKLPAAHTMTVVAGIAGEARRYWDLADHFSARAGTTTAGRAKTAAELDGRIGAAISSRRTSDVPVGVFLSGGIDSSLILAHLTDQSGRGVPVFTLGHADRSFDESRFARRTARHFGADYEELIVTPSELESGLRRIGESMDEPLGDASTIPMYLLAARARSKVKVILSGEGSDELFAGYPTYLGSRLADLYRRIPRRLRGALARGLKRASPVSMGNVGPAYLLGRFLDGAERTGIERHHAWFGSIPPEVHPRLLSHGLLEILKDDDPFASARAALAGRSLPDDLAAMLYADFTMYLQDGLLTKVDRTTMLSSLEARAPFLDHGLAEFVAGLPSDFKMDGTTTKAILRLSAARRLPREILGRRKRGFNIPFSRWLLRGLGDRLCERFCPERVRARGLLSPTGVGALIENHLARKADHRKEIFTLLALDLWCDRTFGEGALVPLASDVSRLPAERVAG